MEKDNLGNYIFPEIPEYDKITEKDTVNVINAKKEIQEKILSEKRKMEVIEK